MTYITTQFYQLGKYFNSSFISRNIKELLSFKLYFNLKKILFNVCVIPLACVNI